MGYFSGVALNSSERFVYIYNEITQTELEQTIDSTMTANGYKHLGKGLYEKGSSTKRLLLGALHKHFKFQITLDAADPHAIKVGVMKATSGMTGGLIGMNQVKNELIRLGGVFQAF